MLPGDIIITHGSDYKIHIPCAPPDDRLWLKNVITGHDTWMGNKDNDYTTVTNIFRENDCATG